MSSEASENDSLDVGPVSGSRSIGAAKQVRVRQNLENALSKLEPPRHRLVPVERMDNVRVERSEKVTVERSELDGGGKSETVRIERTETFYDEESDAIRVERSETVHVERMHGSQHSVLASPEQLSASETARNMLGGDEIGESPGREPFSYETDPVRNGSVRTVNPDRPPPRSLRDNDLDSDLFEAEADHSEVFLDRDSSPLVGDFQAESGERVEFPDRVFASKSEERVSDQDNARSRPAFFRRFEPKKDQRNGRSRNGVSEAPENDKQNIVDVASRTSQVAVSPTIDDEPTGATAPTDSTLLASGPGQDSPELGPVTRDKIVDTPQPDRAVVERVTPKARLGTARERKGPTYRAPKPERPVTPVSRNNPEIQGRDKSSGAGPERGFQPPPPVLDIPVLSERPPSLEMPAVSAKPRLIEPRLAEPAPLPDLADAKEDPDPFDEYLEDPLGFFDPSIEMEAVSERRSFGTKTRDTQTLRSESSRSLGKNPERPATDNEDEPNYSDSRRPQRIPHQSRRPQGGQWRDSVNSATTTARTSGPQPRRASAKKPRPQNQSWAENGHRTERGSEPISPDHLDETENGRVGFKEKLVAAFDRFQYGSVVVVVVGLVVVGLSARFVFSSPSSPEGEIFQHQEISWWVDTNSTAKSVIPDACVKSLEALGASTSAVEWTVLEAIPRDDRSCQEIIAPES